MTTVDADIRQQIVRLNSRQAAEVLGCSMKSLARAREWRRQGIPVGPEYYHPPGQHPFYTLGDLLRFLEQSKVSGIARFHPASPGRSARR
jgi:hypothetical protein